MKKLIVLLFLLFALTITPKKIFAQTSLSNSEVEKIMGLEDYSPSAVLPSGYTVKNSVPQQITQGHLLTEASAANLPNIVFILVDDQPPGLLGVAGNITIQTPTIDNLANQGLYFRNMYVPLGICAPSRASIWTGKYPHTNGVTKNGLILPPDQLTLPEILKANGYFTGIIGKCHLGDPNDPEKYKRGFDFRLISYPDWGGINDWYNYQFSRNGTIETYTDRYITDFLTDESINFIKNNAQTRRPFFLWLAHFAPHRPTTPPRGVNTYDKNLLPLPVSISDDLSTKPPQLRDSGIHKFFQGLGIGGVRQELDDAYEVMSNVDSNVARTLKALDDVGIRNNTIVIYMSDNGIFYGEHQLERKGPTFFEEQLKVPFIFSYPVMTSAKGKSEALLSSVDILPTLLDILGIPIPTDVQGQSFANILKRTGTEARKSAFFEFFENQISAFPNITWDSYPMRGVVMDGYKWIWHLASAVNGISYDNKNHELYDLKNDLFEMNNILKRLDSNDNPLMRMITDATYGKIIRSLRKELAVWQATTADPIRRIISDFVYSVGPDSINLHWKSDLITTSEVEYKEKNCTICVPIEINDYSLVTDHSVNINGLKSGLYQVKVYSIGPNGSGAYHIEEIKTQGTPSGDIDKNGKVDIFDYNLLVANFGKTGVAGFTPADIDNNGKVDIFDYNILVGNFGKIQ
ncbi:sulfatase-like hydrolase/transferase [Candidatus Gottesmanbacteria bacterium]|nr:sulfatase-like hydrolase/transferase [Candidatus Gottesmanbacteria bacterium]